MRLTGRDKLMPSLRCPRCNLSDLHAVLVEIAEIDPKANGIVALTQQRELSCKRCGWAPSVDRHPNKVLSVIAIDR